MKIEEHRVRLARCIYTGHVENQKALKKFPRWDDLPLVSKGSKTSMSQSHWLSVADFVIGWQEIYR